MVVRRTVVYGVSVEISTNTSTRYYRATYDIDSSLGISPRALGVLVAGLGGLFALADYVEHASMFEKSLPSGEKTGTVRLFGEHALLGNERSYYVVRGLSFNSPLEVVLAVAGTLTLGSSAVYLTGRRALDLFDRFQASRRTKGETDLRLKAYSVLDEDLTTLLTAKQRLRVAESSLDINAVIHTLRHLAELEEIAEDDGRKS